MLVDIHKDKTQDEIDLIYSFASKQINANEFSKSSINTPEIRRIKLFIQEKEDSKAKDYAITYLISKWKDVPPVEEQELEMSSSYPYVIKNKDFIPVAFQMVETKIKTEFPSAENMCKRFISGWIQADDLDAWFNLSNSKCNSKEMQNKIDFALKWRHTPTHKKLGGITETELREYVKNVLKGTEETTMIGRSLIHKTQ